MHNTKAKRSTKYCIHNLSMMNPTKYINTLQRFLHHLSLKCCVFVTDATVRHKYRQPGLETVEVTASNQVSNETDYIVVNVVEEIHSKFGRWLYIGEGGGGCERIGLVLRGRWHQ